MKAYICCATKIFFAWNLMWFALNAHAASFDCTKAKSDVEKLICGDTTTSALDEKLQQAYRTALAATDAPSKKALAQEQRNWIKYTRDICQDTTCLQQVYTDRIVMLARNEKDIVDDEAYSYCELPNDGNHIGGERCVNVLRYRDPSARINSFNQYLMQQKRRGRIIGCSLLIDLSADTSPIGPEHGNHNFGGYCILQVSTQREDVVICNDDMIGNFQMQPAARQERSDRQLIDFTYTRCYEGL